MIWFRYSASLFSAAFSWTLFAQTATEAVLRESLNYDQLGIASVLAVAFTVIAVFTTRKFLESNSKRLDDKDKELAELKEQLKEANRQLFELLNRKN
jgi:septal ring factor EnvC (AmiA/AmiB activator)